MKQRVITAIVLLLILALVVWQINTPLFILVVAFLSAVASNEIMKCAKVTNKYLLGMGTAVAALIPVFATKATLSPWVNVNTFAVVIDMLPVLPCITILVISYFLAMIFGYNHTKFEDVAITVMASVVVPFGFSMFPRLRDFGGNTSQMGIYLIFYGLITALGTDTGAQLGGMAFGKHKMSPNISPKKTVEGAISGVIVSFVLNVVAILLYNHFAENALDKALIITLLVAEPFIAFLSMMGDLSASVLKRNFEVKDFGKIFPGHGGVMDRFDSSLFSLPLTYAVVTLYVKAFTLYLMR